MADLIMFVEGIKSCIAGDDVANQIDKDFLSGYSAQLKFEQIQKGSK